MDLAKIKAIFLAQGCSELLVKRLSANDNSKNQVYLGGSFEILNVLPLNQIEAISAGDWKRERFKASLDFYWLQEDGNLCLAPHSQLILYPKYPEVRFSGFLKGCSESPSFLMANRIPSRLLFLAVTSKGSTIGYVAAPDSILAHEFNQLKGLEERGVFSVLTLGGVADNRMSLLQELRRINELGWIKSKRLDSSSNVIECKSSNCGGYTLEAELGIAPNGYSEPDYLGWEIKQFGVKNLAKTDSQIITLMTPEPTDGLYKTKGTEYFIRNYGYPDKKGRPDRLNFGGVHRVGQIHKTTQLELRLIGFDLESGKIRNSSGRISLVDNMEVETASWSFASLLLHWNRKHDKACYIPSLMQNEGGRQYMFGNEVILGTDTDFQLFLTQMAQGNIVYDPGIKMENVSTKPKIKRRSQFRIKSKYLPELYKNNEIVDVRSQT